MCELQAVAGGKGGGADRPMAALQNCLCGLWDQIIAHPCIKVSPCRSPLLNLTLWQQSKDNGSNALHMNEKVIIL